MRLPDERIALSRGERLEMRQHGTAEFSVLNHAARQELVTEGVVIVAQHMVGKHEHRLTAAGTFLVSVHFVTVRKNMQSLPSVISLPEAKNFLTPSVTYITSTLRWKWT